MGPEDEKKSIVQQAMDQVEILAAAATDADYAEVERISKPGFVGIVKITPGVAALLIRYNTHNRKLSNVSIDTIMGILVRKEWRRTHQGLAFYADGSIMDGQHRLLACVLSGIDLDPIMVSGGYSKDDNDAIDSGSKRTAADAAKLAGVTDADLKCYVVEQFAKYQHLVTYGKPITFTNHQTKMNALQHDNALAAAIAMADATLKKCAIAVMSRKEIACRAFEMVQAGWSPAYTATLLELVNSGTADYDGAPTVALSEAYAKDRDEKSRFKLTNTQRQAMWHKVAGLYSHKTRVAKSAIAWKVGTPFPPMSPPDDIAQAAE
jgi:hypothetical protein